MPSISLARTLHKERRGEMPAQVVVEFNTEKDCVRAIEILTEADETYSCAPPNTRFLITREALRLLEEQKIQFRVVKAKKRI
jgi:hypothetical protein